MYDVAIVGGGPVGIVAANFCGVYGLSAVAFDREATVYDLPRAAGLHHDVQRILHNAGVLDAILPSTCEMRGAEFVDASGVRIIGFETPPGTLLESGYPPLLNIDQPGLEQAMRSCLSAYADVALRVSHEVLAIEQHADHVELEVCDRVSGDTSRVRARWAIGADGATSFVRRSCGISWDSLGYDREWLVIDLETTRPVELTPFCQQICDPDRPVTVIPMPGAQRRWEFQLKPGETREEMEDRDRVWQLLEPWLPREAGRIVRAVVYRFHATIAERFASGRVFLAGDAAHQTPPFMGQGLCTGVRDVENLVWKLAMVRRGQAGEEILDTYGAERRPLAVAMVEHSTNTGKLIDAYAEMARGGPEPPPALQEYAYGGSRVLPDLSEGLLATESSAWAGQMLPQAVVKVGDGVLPFDETVGPHWSVVAKTDPGAFLGERARRFCDAIGAALVEVPDPEGALLPVLDAHEVLVVRPDRLIYGASSGGGIDSLLDRLARQVVGNSLRAEAQAKAES